MPTGALPDPLYHLARQHLLFSGDTRISSLQRWLRIGYEHARALREALRGDALDYHADTDTWHIHPNADRQTDYLLADKLQRAAHLLQGSSALMIATGEGMAADSGLPDLRDAATFSHTWPAVAREGLGFEKMTSPQAFDEHPATAWGMYGQLLNLCRAKEPHAGYTLLRQRGQRMPHGCFVFTSNADGHFHKAGFPAARIYECLGSIHRLQCTTACGAHPWQTGHLHPQVDSATLEWQGELPHCPHCGALARPNLLMIDDGQWNPIRSTQQRMLLDMWLDSTPTPLVLEIGASRAVATVRNFTRRMQRRGSPLIRINLHEADIHNPNDIELALGAKDALKKIGALLQGTR